MVRQMQVPEKIRQQSNPFKPSNVFRCSANRQLIFEHNKRQKSGANSTNDILELLSGRSEVRILCRVPENVVISTDCGAFCFLILALENAFSYGLSKKQLHSRSKSPIFMD